MIEGCKHGPKDLIPQPCEECAKEAVAEAEQAAPFKARVLELSEAAEHERTKHNLGVSLGQLHAAHEELEHLDSTARELLDNARAEIATLKAQRTNCPELMKHDEEFVPHAFNSRTPYEPGDDRDIWCKDCAYHRDHDIHSQRLAWRRLERDVSDPTCAACEVKSASGDDYGRTHTCVGQLNVALSLARQATNGWACYATRECEQAEISRLHREINRVAALKGAQAQKGTA